MIKNYETVIMQEKLNGSPFANILRKPMACRAKKDFHSKGKFIEKDTLLVMDTTPHPNELRMCLNCYTSATHCDLAYMRFAITEDDDIVGELSEYFEPVENVNLIAFHKNYEEYYPLEHLEFIGLIVFMATGVLAGFLSCYFALSNLSLIALVPLYGFVLMAFFLLMFGNTISMSFRKRKLKKMYSLLNSPYKTGDKEA